MLCDYLWEFFQNHKTLGIINNDFILLEKKVVCTVHYTSDKSRSHILQYCNQKAKCN